MWVVIGWGYVEICKFFFKVGVDVNVRDRDGLIVVDVVRNFNYFFELVEVFLI